MQVLAVGKWSKAERRWKMVVALRQLPNGTPTSAPKQHENGNSSQSHRKADR